MTYTRLTLIFTGILCAFTISAQQPKGLKNCVQHRFRYWLTLQAENCSRDKGHSSRKTASWLPSTM